MRHVGAKANSYWAHAQAADLIKDDEIGLAHDGVVAVHHAAQDLRRHNQARRRRVERDVARDQPHPALSKPPAQLAVLLIGEGLDRRRVDGASAVTQRESNGVLGDDGLARRRVRRHEDVLVLLEAQHRSLLKVVELKWIGRRRVRHAQAKVAHVALIDLGPSQMPSVAAAIVGRPGCSLGVGCLRRLGLLGRVRHRRGTGTVGEGQVNYAKLLLLLLLLPRMLGGGGGGGACGLRFGGQRCGCSVRSAQGILSSISKGRRHQQLQLGTLLLLVSLFIALPLNLHKPRYCLLSRLSLG